MEIVVDIEQVGIHPFNQSIRGINPPLTGLIESMRQGGQAYALAATPSDDGTFLVYEGARRLAAATAAGLTEVRLSVENLTDAQVLERIAASDIKEPLPHVVVDKQGCVVGGKAWLVRQMVRGGAGKHEVAASLSVTLDEVSAYLNLHSEEESTLSAVATGKLPFSGYCRVKYKSPEFKKRLVEPATEGKKVSIRNVLKAIADDDPVSGRRVEAETTPVETSRVNPISLLLRIRSDLTALRGMDYPVGEQEIWEDILELMEGVNYHHCR